VSWSPQQDRAIADVRAWLADPKGKQIFRHKIEWRERLKYDEFTFGWAITCHKSQGSQWDNVIVFDESGEFREARANWLYTAVTRAAERVTVVV
jgi:ATP-dependent exoDNAse (exonuclease V) alpha subunit